MKKILSTFLLLAVILQAGTAQKHFGIAQPSDYQNPLRDTLVIATWNVEHFVDTYDNPYIKNTLEDAPEADKIKAKIQRFVEAVRQLDADVLVLQEFESQPFLERIAQNYLKDMGYVFFAAAPSPDWYMNVVLMSRVPIGVVYGYGNIYTAVPGSTDKEGRPETQKNVNTRMVSVEILARPDYHFILHGLHLKAGRNERDQAMRQGQIDFLLGQCQRFQAEDRQTKQVIMGDLNAIPSSAEFLQILKGKQKLKFIHPFESEVFSHPADKPERQLDHILPNIKMYKDMIKVEVFTPSAAREISDHLPVRMLLRMK